MGQRGRGLEVLLRLGGAEEAQPEGVHWSLLVMPFHLSPAYITKEDGIIMVLSDEHRHILEEVRMQPGFPGPPYNWFWEEEGRIRKKPEASIPT